MRFIFPAAALLAACPLPAAATELFAGLHAHAVNTPLSLESDRESGLDVSVGLRGGQIARLFGGSLQPYAFGSLNTKGDTDFLAAGISARFGTKVYVRPGLGIAVHDGSASNFTLPDKLAFGSRVLFEPEIALGAAVTERVSVEASWVHFSHAQIFGKQNPGIDNIGVRVNVAL